MDPVRKAIRAHLVADSTLKGLLSASDQIFHAFAPEKAKYPYVIFNQMSGTPALSMGPKPAFKDQLWLVKGLCRSGDAAQAEAIDARCEAVMNDAPLSIEGMTLLYCLRESDMPPYQEIDAGKAIFHRGGLYRIRVES